MHGTPSLQPQLAEVAYKGPNTHTQTNTTTKQVHPQCQTQRGSLTLWCSIPLIPLWIFHSYDGIFISVLQKYIQRIAGFGLSVSSQCAALSRDQLPYLNSFWFSISSYRTCGSFIARKRLLPWNCRDILTVGKTVCTVGANIITADRNVITMGISVITTGRNVS